VAPSITYENVENALVHCLYENESKKKKKLETISAICDNFDPLTDSSSYHTMAVLQNVNFNVGFKVGFHRICFLKIAIGKIDKGTLTEGEN